VAFGRVTVNFQVASDFDSVAIPERASDPKLGYVGIGMAQGNHPDHEPGSLVVVMLLTEPQADHDARREISNVPPPKAAPKAQNTSNKPLTDQAWLATLTGNHQKAAKLFEKAYRTQKNPLLLYEAARAHARDENMTSALSQMRRYAELAVGNNKKNAKKMVARLEKGETIFTATKKEKMSVEAKRFFVIGQSLFQREEWDGAVDAFQQAYKYSQHAEIIYNIGLTHLRAGRIGDALGFFEEYQRLIPEATNVDEAQQLFDIGVKLYQQKQFESASRHFAMAYGFLPFPELVYNMALCYKAMGENKKAIRFFQEFLSNDLTQKERRAVEAIVQELRSKKPGSP
jgi:tetratricopeptide (TPR) repeat protein